MLENSIEQKPITANTSQQSVDELISVEVKSLEEKIRAKKAWSNKLTFQIAEVVSKGGEAEKIQKFTYFPIRLLKDCDDQIQKLRGEREQLKSKITAIRKRTRGRIPSSAV